MGGRAQARASGRRMCERRERERERARAHESEGGRECASGVCTYFIIISYVLLIYYDEHETAWSAMNFLDHGAVE